MDVFSLRVQRTHVGNAFPFDRVYFVRHDDRGVVEQMFRYALVLPVDEKLKKMVSALKLDEVIERPHDRDDEVSEVRDPKKTELARLLNKGDWLMVVPILSKWLRTKALPKEGEEDEVGQNTARYLTSPKWYSGKKRSTRSDAEFLHTYSYLQVPHRKIRPVCVACSRNIEHQNGLCQLGQSQCHEALSLGIMNHFKEGLNAPTPTPNVKEIEDGLVPEDQA